MRIAGYVILALAIVHLLVAAFAAASEGLAPDYDLLERAMLLVLHPAGAAALVVMLLKPETLGHMVIRNVIGLLLAASVAGDLSAFLAIRQGHTDFEASLHLLFAVVPIVGLAYGIALRSRRARAE